MKKMIFRVNLDGSVNRLLCNAIPVDTDNNTLRIDLVFINNPLFDSAKWSLDIGHHNTAINIDSIIVNNSTNVKRSFLIQSNTFIHGENRLQFIAGDLDTHHEIFRSEVIEIEVERSLNATILVE